MNDSFINRQKIKFLQFKPKFISADTKMSYLKLLYFATVEKSFTCTSIYEGTQWMIFSQIVLRTVDSFFPFEARIFSRTSVQPSPLRRLYIARIRDERTFRTVVGKTGGKGARNTRRNGERMLNAKIRKAGI